MAVAYFTRKAKASRTAASGPNSKAFRCTLHVVNQAAPAKRLMAIES